MMRSATPELILAQKHERRRVHTKTRTGCLTCKARRVKCDEGRPTCRKCAIGNRPCSYKPSRSPDNDSSEPPPRVLSSSSRVATPKSSPLVLAESDLTTLCSKENFTALHMILLYHATTTMADYMALVGDVSPIIATALSSSCTAPYLLDQLLAFAALHRSTQDTATAALFQYQATELQTRALSLFNEARDDISAANCVPSFIFASLLGIHILHNTLSNHQNSLTIFIEAFVKYMHINGGVRAVTNSYWEEILQSDLRPLLNITQWMVDAEVSVPGEETAQLRAHLESSSRQSDTSTKTSLEALRRVQWMLDLKAQAQRTTDSSFVALHIVMAWPHVVPKEYIEDLRQHRPEALVILSFFVAAIHEYREFWIFADAGSVLVQLIIDHVGPFWADMLAWPRTVIAGS